MSIRELSKYTFTSKYAKYLEDESRRESWTESVNRVKNMHLGRYPQIADEIEWAFERVHSKLVLPAMRTLQYGGNPILKNHCRAYNCSASYCDRIRFFQEIVYVLLSGTGAGFSVQKHHIDKLPPIIERTKKPKTFTIQDSIEGWSDAFGVLLSSYVDEQFATFPEYSGHTVNFNFRLIRPKGSKISSGGKSPGPQPLENALNKCEAILNRCINSKLRPIDAYDIIMHSSDCVISGGVRRSATLSLFSIDDEEMMTAKTGNWFYENPQRGRSNNSVLLERGKVTEQEFLNVIKNTKEFGEPGFVWCGDKEQLYNPCQPAWAKVLTPEGIRTFADISEGSTIWSNEGWTKVVKKWSTGTNEVYKYRTAAGVFYGTENHRVVQKGEKIEVKYADYIDYCEGDSDLPGVFSTDDYIQRCGEVFDLTFRNVPKWIMYGDKVTVHSFLDGLMSNLHKSSKENRLGFASQHLSVLEDVQTLFASIGRRTFITTNGDTHYLNTGDHNGAALPILSRELVSEEETFDITVDNSSHTYWTQGCNVSNCVEIGLYAYDSNGNSGWQFCNLTIANGKKIKNKDIFREASRASAIIGTCQAAYTDFNYLGSVTEEIVRKEALLGCSMTGIMENPDVTLDPSLQMEMAQYILEINEQLASKLNINPCARATCVKPEGCQKGDTLVTTSNGIFKLSELGNVNGNTWQPHNINILTEDGYKQSTNFFVNGKKPTKQIKLHSGLTLEGTYNHQYKVLRNGNLEWVRVDEIVVGDIIPQKLGGYDNNKYITLNQFDIGNHYKARKSICQPKILNEDIAWLIGLYTGDGSNHKPGIRIHGNKTKKDDLYKANLIIKNNFNFDALLQDDKNSNRCTLYFNSREILRWLSINNLLKNKSSEIEIPLLIRMSPPSVIQSFLDGYFCADGCKNNSGRSWVTTSKIMAEQVVSLLFSIGLESRFYDMPPTSTSKGNKMRYWIQERKGWNTNKCSKYRHLYELFKTCNLLDFSPDFVVSINDSECETYDVEVPENHNYISYGIISHNTSSAVLGTSSGIHPHHSRRYFRRVQANKTENVYAHFNKYNPQACEDSVWSANKTDAVLTFCIEVEKGSRLKNDMDALSLLETVKNTQQNWVEYGTRHSNCVKPWLRHSVSNTISVKENEWDDVAQFIYNNRQYFAGVSLLPSSGDKDYPQAPFCTVFTSNELLKIYGDGVLFCSGLIEKCLRLFDGNLWKACDYINGVFNVDANEEYQLLYDKSIAFSFKYFNGDIKQMTYALKDVYNLKLWNDLNRDYQEVDYGKMLEQTDNTNFMGESACAGGKCEII